MDGTSFNELYDEQMKYQSRVQKMEGEVVGLPNDSTYWFKYHMVAVMEELGEVLKADKRWKTHRNVRYIKDEKLDEIADVFITVMNIAIYSGISADELANEIKNKIKLNNRRFDEYEAYTD